MFTLLMIILFLASSCTPLVISAPAPSRLSIVRSRPLTAVETTEPDGIGSQILAWMRSDEGVAALKDAECDEHEPWIEDELSPDSVVINSAAPDHARPLPSESADESDFEARGLREEAYLGKGLALRASHPERAAQAVRRLGVARLDSVLSERTALALHAHVLEELQRLRSECAAVAAAPGHRERDDGSFQLVSVGSGTQRLSDGSTRETRWDVRLSRETPIVAAALRELLGAAAPLGRTLEALGGRRAQLWELAAIVSVGGAAPQIVHADAMWTPTPLLLTAFVALQPVTRAMGPTRFLPRTHTSPQPAKIVAKTDATGLHGNPIGGADAPRKPPLSWVGLLGTGDAALYDGRLLHCGGANRAGRPRILFYVTFRAADATEVSNGGGTGCTLADFLT